MELHIKQRIVGALVLVAILAIFLPWLFHHSQAVSPLRIPQEIPPQPPEPQVSLEMPKAINPQMGAASAKVNTVPVATPVPATTAATNTPSWQNLAKEALSADLPVQFAVTSAVTKAVVAKNDAIATESPVTNTASVVSEGVPTAWVIQLATFSNQKNANELIQTLRAKGFDAYLRKTHVAGKLQVRVYVGPNIRKAEIEKIQQQLQQQFHLKGVVAKYSV